VRTKLIQFIKRFIRLLIPLKIRKNLAIKISNQTWISSDNRAGWSLELIRDMEKSDVNAFHKFLWSNHIGYADTYEVEQRFGEVNINESRKLLFSDMEKVLSDLDINYQNEIASVLDVGCSLGYLLKYMEDNIFVNASELHGIDIDAYAIDEGGSYLNAHDSKINLMCHDMEEIIGQLNNKIYDVIFCAGTLLYLDENKAKALTNKLVKHTKKLLVITGIASPETDNSNLQKSSIRKRDGSFLHNIDDMVKQSGGKVVSRRWEGTKKLGGNSLYFVFVTP